MRCKLPGLLAFLTLASSQLYSAPAPPTTPAQSLAEITDRFRMGTEFFLNRTDTKEAVNKHFQVMREHGITIVRIFVIWDDIERTPGEWRFDGYDWIYNAAAANGIKIAATLCAEDPPGWRKLTPFYHSRTNLNDPEVKKYAAVYIDKVVRRYRNHPAQGVWLLMNEPALKYNFAPSTMKAFGQWLQHKYGSVQELNKRWFQPLTSFSEVRVAPEQWEQSWTDYSSFVDWKEFNVENLCQHLRWIKDRIRELDPVHATHLNQPGLARDMMAGNQDPWQEGKIVDFLGASIHPAWNFGDFKRSEFGLAWSYSLDLLRSSAGGRPWWVTELQSGSTAFTGRRPMNPTVGEMNRWTWDAVGAGAKAVVYWLWHPRTIGNEGGEWGLVSIDGKPSERAQTTKDVVDSVNRVPVLNIAKPIEPRVAILYNRETLLVSQLDGRAQVARKRKDEPLFSLFGCYRALYDAHVQVAFLDVPGLKAGAAKGLDVLYLPYSYALDDQALAAIREFVKAGGTVWADGLTAWKNEYGDLRNRIPGGLEDVFGVEAADVYPVEDPYSVTSSGEQGGQSWRLPLELKGATVLLRDEDGHPFATKNHFGNGTAIYYTSAVSLASWLRANPVVESWIAGPAVEASMSSAVRLTRSPGGISFRALEYPGGKLAVLSNWGSDSEVTVSFQGRYQSVNDALSGRPVTTHDEAGNTLASIKVSAGAVVVLDAKNKH